MSRCSSHLQSSHVSASCPFSGRPRSRPLNEMPIADTTAMLAAWEAGVATAAVVVVGGVMADPDRSTAGPQA